MFSRLYNMLSGFFPFLFEEKQALNIKGVSRVMGAMGVGRIATFTATILATRWVAQSDFGYFAFYLSLVGIFVTFLNPGLDRYLMRELPPLYHQKKYNIASTVLKKARITVFAILFLFFMVLLSGAFFNWIPAGMQVRLCVLTLFIAAVRSFTLLFRACIHSRGRVVFARFLDTGLPPLFYLLSLSLVVYFQLLSPEPEVLLSLWLAGECVAGGVAAVVHLRQASDDHSVSGEGVEAVSYANMLRESFFIGVLAQLIALTFNSAPLILGLFGQMEEVAKIKIALQFALLIQFLLNALASPLNYKVAHLKAQEKMVELQGEVGRYQASGYLFGVPLVAAIFAFAPLVMHVVGPEYHVAVPALRWLVIMQFAMLTWGLTGSILLFGGQTIVSIKGWAITLVLVSSLVGAGSYLFGATGAAIGFSAGMLFGLACQAELLRRHMGVKLGVGQALGSFAQR